MSCASTNPTVSCPQHRHAPWYRHAWRACAQALARHRGRRALVALDDRQRADVGLTRAQVLREARKPFWVR